MIRTKSIYEQIHDDDGLRVLITRFHPRGVKRERYDVWVRSLSPSTTLLKLYRNNHIDWNDFTTRLLDEFAGNTNSIKAILAFHENITTQNITLLCYEGNDHPCHRYLVKDLIKDPKPLMQKERKNNHCLSNP